MRERSSADAQEATEAERTVFGGFLWLRHPDNELSGPP
jgi:hypothetical protein